MSSMLLLVFPPRHRPRQASATSTFSKPPRSTDRLHIYPTALHVVLSTMLFGGRNGA